METIPDDRPPVNQSAADGRRRRPPPPVPVDGREDDLPVLGGDYPDPCTIGWPWCNLLAAALAYATSDRRVLAAGVAGDARARAEAELDRAAALDEWVETRRSVAQAVLLGLRVAALEFPTGLAELLAVVEPIRQIAADVETVAGAVVQREGRGT